MKDKVLAIWLSEALFPGCIYGKKLFEKYGTLERIYGLDAEGYSAVGIAPSSDVMTRLLDKRLDEYNTMLSFCDNNYFHVIEYTSDMYPERLKAIKDPPPVLYARGRMIDFDDNVCIAVVGTRSYTDAGWNATYKVTSGLAAGGAVIVTGLASGIDTAAARAALDSSGFVVGVLGSGVERIYPSENRELFGEIYQKGLVISEKAPYSAMSGSYFPTRNRLISGLCNGVLMGEGSTKSGAMHTVAHGSEQGRHIFAIPGDISGEESTGVNKLIREGATPVFDAKDILAGYEYFYPHRIWLNNSGISDVEVPDERSVKRVRVIRGKSTVKKNAGASDVPTQTDIGKKDTVKTRTPATKDKSAASADKAPYSALEAKKQLVKADTVWKMKHLKKDQRTTAKDLSEFFEPVFGTRPDTTVRDLSNDPVKGMMFEAVFEANMENLGKRLERTDEERKAFMKPSDTSSAHGRTEASVYEEKPTKKEEDMSFMSEADKKIYDCICSAGTVAVDSICTQTGIDLMTVNASLTTLEMFGFIETYGASVRKVTK